MKKFKWLSMPIFKAKNFDFPKISKFIRRINKALVLTKLQKFWNILLSDK